MVVLCCECIHYNFDYLFAMHDFGCSTHPSPRNQKHFARLWDVFGDTLTNTCSEYFDCTYLNIIITMLVQTHVSYIIQDSHAYIIHVHEDMSPICPIANLCLCK